MGEPLVAQHWLATQLMLESQPDFAETAQINLRAMQSASVYSMSAHKLVSHQRCTKKYSDPALLEAESLKGAGLCSRHL